MRLIRNGFTLIELLIVITILGIMAMIVVPHFVGASNSSRGAALADQMRIIREQMSLYRAQHQGQWPGVEATGGIASDGELLTNQLTGYTDRNGNTSANKGGDYVYGPYLPNVPANPVSGLKTVLIDVGSAKPTPDGTTGWIFQPATGKVWSNQTGEDSNGKAYIDY